MIAIGFVSIAIQTKNVVQKYLFFRRRNVDKLIKKAIVKSTQFLKEPQGYPQMTPGCP